MKYEKPHVRIVEVAVKINTDASEKGSCAGGNCVKSRYAQDP